MPKYLILADLHFGHPSCSLQNESFARSFVSALREQIEPSPIFGYPAVSEVIFLGDTFELQQQPLRSLMASPPEGLGFKKFVSLLDEAISPTRYIYLIGNTDYSLFPAHDLVSLSKEKNPAGSMKRPSVPIYLDEIESFLKTLFPIGSEVVFKYPAYWIELQNAEDYVVLTHGHHFDPFQSWGKRLSSVSAVHREELFQELGGIDYYNRWLHEQFIARTQPFYASMQFHEKRFPSRRFWNLFFRETRVLDSFSPEAISMEEVKIFIKYFSGVPGQVRPIAPCRGLIYGHTLKQMSLERKGLQLINPGSALSAMNEEPQLNCLLLLDKIETAQIQFQLLHFQKSTSLPNAAFIGKTIDLTPGEKNCLGETVHYQITKMDKHLII
ncbi:MAG: hypothetical protein AABZ60_01370, partial [Planctomycetota bacterium]